MSHRVIAGLAKGRRLKLVPGEGTRPVMDRVKEALFSILGSDVQDAMFLDLFAGTGSVGIEALSRGAERAWFIDNQRAAIDVIHENLQTTRLADRAMVLRADVFAQLAGQPPARFDMIYVAPPQYLGLWQRALTLLDVRHPWTPPGCLVMVQIDPNERTDVPLTRLELTDERRYGNTLLLFYEVPVPDDDAAHAPEADAASNAPTVPTQELPQ